MAQAKRRTTSTKPKAPTGQGGVAGTSVTIDEDPNGAAPQYPRLERTSPFLLGYHPHRWCVLEGRVIPLLGQLKIEAGFDGCEMGKKGPRWRKAAAAWAERGWTIIPTGACLPKGESYLRSVQVRGGLAHVTRWTSCFGGSDALQVDAKGYADWIDKLFKAGELPTPLLHALESFRSRLEQDLMAVADKVATSPSKANLAGRLKQDLEAVEKYIQKIQKGGGDAAVPVPTQSAAEIPDED